MNRRSPLVLAAAGLLSLATGAAALDAVYVVRHAQKDLHRRWNELGTLRPLSRKGAVCTGGFGRRLADSGVAAVYSSPTARTLSTAAGLAEALGGVPIHGDGRAVRPEPGWVLELVSRHAGDRAIALVGHSNTVADLLLAFRYDLTKCLPTAGLDRTGVPETRYGDLWRLDLDRTREACAALHHQSLGQLDGVDCTTR